MNRWKTEWIWTIVFGWLLLICCGPCLAFTLVLTPLMNTQLSTPEVMPASDTVFALDAGSTLTPQPTPTLSRSVPVLGGTVVVPVGPSTFEGRQGIVPTLPPSVE